MSSAIQCITQRVVITKCRRTGLIYIRISPVTVQIMTQLASFVELGLNSSFQLAQLHKRGLAVWEAASSNLGQHSGS